MEDRANLFQPFVGKLVRCVFQDGEVIQCKKAKLVKVEKGFLVLETLKHKILIHSSQVLKLSDVNEGGREA
jgi:hypothetical protein